MATCLPGGGLRLRRLSTTLVGGCVPSCFDALVQPSGLASAAAEAMRMREALTPEAGRSPGLNGGASLVEWARAVQLELDHERLAEAAPPKERGLAYSPELWVRENRGPVGKPPPPPPSTAEPVHPTAAYSSVGWDAKELDHVKKTKDLKNKNRNKFALMESESESKASGKMQNVGHNGTDSWEMEAAMKAKHFTQGVKATPWTAVHGVKGTVNEKDYMIAETLTYQKQVKDVRTPDKSLYQGIAAKIPVDAYLIEEQRNVKAIIRANRVEGDQNTAMPAPKYGPDNFLAEAYKNAAALISSAQAGIEESTIVRSTTPAVKSKHALAGLGRSLFGGSAKPANGDGPLYAGTAMPQTLLPAQLDFSDVSAPAAEPPAEAPPEPEEEVVPLERGCRVRVLATEAEGVLENVPHGGWFTVKLDDGELVNIRGENGLRGLAPPPSADTPAAVADVPPPAAAAPAAAPAAATPAVEDVDEAMSA